MIGWLKGVIRHQGNGYIILDVAGVGYKVFTANHESPARRRFASSDAGGRITNHEWFTHHHVREDSEDLYGFKTFEELEFFELLISVPGVGPKVAMTVMSAGNLEKLRNAIIKSDTAVLTALGGVGPKLAAKIIVELKPKLVRGATIDLASFGKENQEVIDALLALGYRRQEVSAILAKLPADLDSTQAKVTWALKQLVRSTDSGST